jgi:hypothetical protein|tara:strand:- start:5821 stop:6468 length:648 start_codon:yes stop_codon:yes gene_type:complete
MFKFNYDIKKYDFKSLFCRWLNTDDLTTLHNEKKYPVLTREEDMYMHWNQIYYKRWREDSSIKDLYLKFLEDVIKPRFGEEIIYQELPDIRIHLPNNIAVGEFHKDKHYRNEKWAKEVRELNYFVPLTESYGTNTLWAETEEDKGDYTPFESDYGECTEWRGSFLTHGNKINKTSITRVSFDFRVIPKSRYKPSEHTSINMKIPFKIGGYYGGIV